MISLLPRPGNGSSATLSTRAQSKLSGGGLPWPPIRLRRLKAEEKLALLLKAEVGSTVMLPASMVNTSILPCARVAINQNDRRAVLLFDTFATSYAGRVIAHERTAPRENDSSTYDSSPPL
jgi:hypothetical protein